uniref:Uncharacterized protein n=1 Tax=Nelumbo nucifera TaxID=4432 RepID=A0A822YRU5_NELNU|nr:TPA_asm: hypothetical protein HUJ06_012347 [Nelumbo nucifera]
MIPLSVCKLNRDVLERILCIIEPRYMLPDSFFLLKGDSTDATEGFCSQVASIRWAKFRLSLGVLAYFNLF